MEEILKHVIYHNAIETWLTAGLTTLLCFAGFSVLKNLIVRRLKKWEISNNQVWRDAVVEVLKGTSRIAILCLAGYVGGQVLNLPPRADLWASRLIFLVFLTQVTFWGMALIKVSTEHYLNASAGFDGARTTSVRAMAFLARLLFFSLVVLWGLDNLGINITTLIAGLGVGGVAIALAVQNILGDLFASLTIVLDKPFVLGDTIAVDTFEGTIENIGLKTTRLRSVAGEQLVFPNGGLLQSRIRNLQRMSERRGLFTLAVSYETDAAKLRAIPGLVQAVIEAQPKTRFVRCNFKIFNTSSLDFEVLYWMTVADYQLFMDTQQAINLAIFERFQNQGIKFAYPTPAVVVQNAPPAIKL